MAYFVDTGVLLRLFDRTDPEFPAIRDCMRRLRSESDRPRISMQNLTEFWSVSTRPSSSRGGYGVPIHGVAKRLRFLETLCDVLFPSPQSLREWAQLVVTHNVLGVQVHDAHLVALMRVAGLSTIVTLNKADFARYSGIVAVTPIEVLATTSTGESTIP